MTAGRRPLIIALAIAIAAIVVLLILLITSSDNNNAPGTRPTPSATATNDARAAARAAIAETALAYQRALAPKSSDDPCKYMTAEAGDDAMVFADPPVRARGCKAAVRESESKQARPLYEVQPPGVTNIRFLPRVPVAGIQGTAAGAQATWRGDSTRSATFIEQDGRWLVAK